MHFSLIPLSLAFHLGVSASATPINLNLTALSASDGASTLDCWQLSAPFVVSQEAGVSGAAIEQLGNLANGSFTVLPAKFNGGLHRAPAVQYVVPGSSQYA